MSLLREFLQSPIVGLNRFSGLPATEGLEPDLRLKTGTLPVSENRWMAALRENTGTYDVNEAGLYCFWWTGEAEILERGHKTHWLKGKAVGKDQDRLVEGLQTVKNQHILHKRTWKFHPQSDLGTVPLYVGKGSSILKRVRLHLRWPRSAWPKYPQPPAVTQIARTGSVHTSTQFRKPFEYLSQSVTNDIERTQLLIEQVGISFINIPFHDVAARFFGEDELIGRLRPPFNLDSER